MSWPEAQWIMLQDRGPKPISYTVVFKKAEKR